MDAREAREARESRESREAREARENREVRESRESREARESRESREAREAREARESRDIKEAANTRLATAPQNPAVAQTPVTPQQQIMIVPGSSAPVYPPASHQITVHPPAGGVPQASATSAPTIVTPAPVVVTQPSAPASASASSSAYSPPATVVQSAPPSPSPVPPGEVQVLPGLPDRSSRKIFRLQVAAFSSIDGSSRVCQTLRAAGFNVVLEQYGSLYRVMVTGIPSADVWPVAQRLGSMGFRQIWVRE
jgi:cell division septation protein DedD